MKDVVENSMVYINAGVIVDKLILVVDKTAVVVDKLILIVDKTAVVVD